MYYNPYFEELKDERLEVISEETIDDTKFILLKLHTQCNNPCPKCHSNNTIRYGARKRKIEMILFVHFKTGITLEFSRLRNRIMYVKNDDATILDRRKLNQKNYTDLFKEPSYLLTNNHNW